MTTSTPKLYLASSSPRRLSLLREAGFDVDVAPTGIDDGSLAPGETDGVTWPTALAYLKAVAGVGRVLDARLPTENALVLGADTVIVKDGRIIGQPDDEQHAIEIITSLRNGSHSVVTGVALVRPELTFSLWRRVFADDATVTVGDLSDDAIAAYAASGAWQGKAGGYNLAERIEDGWPISAEGDPATVMGIPILRLREMLASIAGRPGSA